jgi:hypothetical protein
MRLATSKDFSQLVTPRRAFDWAVRRKRFDTSSSVLRASPLSSVGKARVNWSFSRLSLMSSAAYLPLRTVQAFVPVGTTMPSADSSHPVRKDHSTLSLAAKTDERSPEVRSTAFSARPPDLHPGPLMDMDFVKTSSLVRSGLPHIWFLFIGPRLCSTLPSDPTSR